MPVAKLAVSEIFGPTIQGEGPHTGRLAYFLRLAGCNLSCSWCDTPFTWNWKEYVRSEEITMYTVEEVRTALVVLAGSHLFRKDSILVCTGGEPLLQQDLLADLARVVSCQGWKIEVETNGTRFWDHAPSLIDQFNVSPKLPHSGCKPSKRFKPDVLKAFADYDNVAFKFVCETIHDLDKVEEIVKQCRIRPDQIWIMPEGVEEDTINTRLRYLAERVIQRGWNISTRLHTVIWGNVRLR